MTIRDPRATATALVTAHGVMAATEAFLRGAECNGEQDEAGFFFWQQVLRETMSQLRTQALAIERQRAAP